MTIRIVLTDADYEAALSRRAFDAKKEWAAIKRDAGQAAAWDHVRMRRAAVNRGRLDILRMRQCPR